MKFDKCPKCGASSTYLNDYWTKGRKLKQFCIECDWEGEPRVPETIPVESTKQVQVHKFFGWCYSVFDRYGHTLIVSKAHSSRECAVEALNKDLDIWNKNPDVGPCKAVLWPPSVSVEGQVFRGTEDERCPECQAELLHPSGGGVKCSKCSYWFCY